jgi:hypothetical protein
MGKICYGMWSDEPVSAEPPEMLKHLSFTVAEEPSA